MIPDHVLDAIKAATDLPSLVQEYGVRLQRVAGGYVARCPFHDEKTASFRIHTVGERKGVAHCFGCGWGGSSIHFLMKIEGKSFPAAVRELAERAGISIETQRVSRVQAVANKEDVACAAWWWNRHRETGLGLLADAMTDPDLAYDDDWADTIGRILRAIDAMKPEEKLQQFQFNVTGADRTEWRREVADRRAAAKGCEGETVIDWLREVLRSSRLVATATGCKDPHDYVTKFGGPAYCRSVEDAVDIPIEIARYQLACAAA
jgi:hypothetical protein